MPRGTGRGLTQAGRSTSSRSIGTHDSETGCSSEQPQTSVPGHDQSPPAHDHASTAASMAFSTDSG